MNAIAVLGAMRARGPVTGSELMADTGLSRPTIHAVCADLIERGLVREIEGRSPESVSRPGRRPRQYVFNAQSGHVLGIDLGAKKVTAQLADLRGECVAETTLLFADEHVQARARMNGVRRSVRRVLDEAGAEPATVRAVTMGVPAPVDPDGHVVASQEYLPGLSRRDLRNELSSFGWTTHVENDANLALTGERWRGVAAGCDNVVELLAGYRLGSALFMNGQLIRGGSGRAGELNFLSMVEGVGNTDAIAELAERYGAEALSSAPKRRRSQAAPGSLRERAGGNPEDVHAEMVFEAARAGDPEASQIVDRVLDRIARVIALFSTFLNPELVVVGGAVAGSGDVIIPGLERRLPALTGSPPRLAASTLGDHAVVTGAVRLSLDAVEATLLRDPA